MTDRPAINAVIEHYDGTVRDRRSYMTNCVFHDDQTPSLSVNTERDLFNCMSCGRKGDSFTLIMLKEETDFRGAVTTAATLGLADGSSGGGGSELSGGHYSGRRTSPGRSRDRQSNGGYVPRWRRR